MKKNFSYSFTETIELIRLANSPFLPELILEEVSLELKKRIPDDDLFEKICQAVCQ